LFRLQIFATLATVALSFVFGNYYPIVVKLGLKDLSRDLLLNYVISYFLLIFNALCTCLKIDVMKKVKKLKIWRVSKQDPGLCNSEAIVTGLL
jgi:hypothetical protein